MKLGLGEPFFEVRWARAGNSGAFNPQFSLNDLTEVLLVQLVDSGLGDIIAVKLQVNEELFSFSLQEFWATVWLGSWARDYTFRQA